MIEIKFSGTSAENVFRQIEAFVEKAKEKGDGKNGRQKQTVSSVTGDVGQRQHQ